VTLKTGTPKSGTPETGPRTGTSGTEAPAAGTSEAATASAAPSVAGGRDTGPPPGVLSGPQVAEGSAVDILLERNRKQALSHPYWLGPVPTLRIAMVVCMDARVDMHAAFSLTPGEAHLMRNAGGVVTEDIIRSLAISQMALGTREIMIVHHTDCGLAKIDEEEFRAQLAAYAGYRPTWSVQAFSDPHDSVRESLRRVRDSPFLLHRDAVRGFIFDVQSGLLEEIHGD
jgi:carbonic anhydrase